MQYDDNDNQSKHIEYPCPVTNELTTTDDCIDCETHLKCDIYSTMLDENMN